MVVVTEHFNSSFLPKHIDRLLDVGCKDAAQSELFAIRAHQTFAIDPDLASLIANAPVRRHIHLAAAVAEALPFPDESFDCVTLMGVLEHIDVGNERRALEEIHRVLRPGGTFVIQVPHAGLFDFLDPLNFKLRFPLLVSWYYRWSGKSSHYFELFKQKNPSYRNISFYRLLKESPELLRHRHYTLSGLSNLMEGLFTIERVHRGGFFLLPLVDCVFNLTAKMFGVAFHFLLRVGDWERRRDFGRFAYDMIVGARKR